MLLDRSELSYATSFPRISNMYHCCTMHKHSQINTTTVIDHLTKSQKRNRRRRIAAKNASLVFNTIISEPVHKPPEPLPHNIGKSKSARRNLRRKMKKARMAQNPT